MGLYVGWVMGDLWAPPLFFSSPSLFFLLGLQEGDVQMVLSCLEKAKISLALMSCSGICSFAFCHRSTGFGKSCFALGTVTCCLTATDGFFLSGFCLMLDSHLIKHLRMQIKDANEQTQLLSAAEALSSCGCFPCLWPCSN